MSDRELLELAAKAAGYVIDQYLDTIRVGWVYQQGAKLNEDGEYPIFHWNPLTNDGDALRLAVNKRFRVEVNEASIVIYWTDDEFESHELYEYPESVQDEDFNIRHINHNKATRRAIVRAAAEIGKEK